MIPFTSLALALAVAAAPADTSLLPDGKPFVSWEKPLKFGKTYVVDNGHPQASDENPGTEGAPFRTINRAAQMLQPGERVIIKTGVYRELVSPARGGTGPDKMISYEAAPGAKVVVKGSRVVKGGWKPSTGFAMRGRSRAQMKIWQLDLEAFDFKGYNPFGMVNIIEDRGAARSIGSPPRGLRPHLLRRGMVFVDGKRLAQAEVYRELGEHDGAFWVEHNGLTLHVRLPGDADPAAHEIELVTQEQVFAPRERFLSYIRVKGITFEHAANGYPISQRGLVSVHRGHHWIIEDCVLRHANSVALDIGNETWNAERPEVIGYSIVRRKVITDTGLCGIAGLFVMNTLIEDNLFERSRAGGAGATSMTAAIRGSSPTTCSASARTLPSARAPCPIASSGGGAAPRAGTSSSPTSSSTAVGRFTCRTRTTGRTATCTFAAARRDRGCRRRT